MFQKISWVVVAIALVSGCATSYQSQGLSGGFTETQLDTNVWRVSFRGNGYTNSERAEDFALLRSAELALQNGFTHFAFASSRTGAETSLVTTPKTSYTTGSANIYGNNIVGSSTTQTTGGQTYMVSRPTANNTVVMFKGKPEVATMVYDAGFICKSLGLKYKVVCNSQP